MKNRIIKALTSPIVVVCICLCAAATCFAISNDITLNAIGFGYDKIVPSKELSTKVYTITEKYNEIDVTRGVKVIYRVVAGTPSTEVTAPSNIVDHVNVSVRKNKLVVTIDDNVQINGSVNTTVTVSGPAIEEFSAASAGQIIVESAIKLPGKIEVDASSAGRIEFVKEVIAKKAEIEASSASKIVMSSLVSDSGDIEASSAASVSIEKVKGREYEVESSSASSIKIEEGDFVNLEASASSGSKISISGTAERANLDASSGATVGGDNLAVKYGVSKTSSSGGRVKTK